MCQVDRVLSIQSHVSYGYVGGKAAVFPLQCLGFDVDVVNTVNFSNHVHYGTFEGSIASEDELQEIFRGLEANGLLKPARLLTGYIRGGRALSAISEMASKVKEANPDLIYLLDPAIGDAGAFYVSPDVIPVYRSMLPLATVITPNWFEVETLTDIKLQDFSSLRRAFKALHTDYKVANIVMSSIPLQPWLLDVLPSNLCPSGDGDFLLCICSSASKDMGPPIVHASPILSIPGYYTGAGDVFSALLLGHLERPLRRLSADETSLSRAVSFAVTKTHAIVQLTYDYNQSLPEKERPETDDEKDNADPVRRVRRARGRELRIVQGHDIIRAINPDDDRRMGVWRGFWDESN